MYRCAPKSDDFISMESENYPLVGDARISGIRSPVARSSGIAVWCYVENQMNEQEGDPDIACD